MTDSRPAPTAPAPAEPAPSYDVLGIPISVTTLEAAAQSLRFWANDRKGRYIGVREVPSLMAMRDDPVLTQIARGAAMNLPDGMPLVWIGRSRGLPVTRSCGPDLMEKMLSEAPQDGLRHFLYGGKPGVAERVAEVFRARAPGARIVGAYCPPFRPLTAVEDAEVIRLIRESGADIVWIGLSSPKQDIWMAEHVAALPATLIGVGAAFDFHAGTVRRAPRWMQRAGLEWLHRLISEPRRLWRRYLILAPRFVWLILRNAGAKA
ncbi:WecB/TagA/CpsF family glycosyltransferase [Sinirhodobacter sp. HNIBRBA609]|nr:WecB/TagA/CpsF family glycosyltransferase [Sinirhodobacter sp. HNIBRBA609]